MKIIIYPRSTKVKKNFPITIEVPDDITTDQLKSEIHKRFPKYYPERQRLTNGDKPLQEDKTLKESGLKDGDTIFFKDLGPQISWRLVYAIEIAFYLIMAHFIKREFETFFVHRFSHSTMPLLFIFKNSFHYHVLCGLNLAYWLYGPWDASGTPASERSKWFVWTCIAVYMYAEIANLNTHIILRNLRPPGTKIPLLL
ncbi:5841_t:CDS:2 [Diversispora eburnea]|uniref:5841_t:CDS:1 n=1 Tax=Diversispora eburnea TaxID=1213867 RepID=A0A9N9AVH3_9GLOM|nr:5841_t:CDS:2 [Diversispora eburnea]